MNILRTSVLGIALAALPPSALGGAWMKTDKGCLVWNSDPKPGETATWTGTCAGGKVSGQGKLTWKSGSHASTYVGSYKAGKRIDLDQGSFDVDTG